MSRLGQPKVIPCTKFEHFWIIRFLVMHAVDKQTNKQTNKQTEQPENRTHANRHIRRG